MRYSFWTLLTILCLPCVPCRAELPARVDFERHVLPLFDKLGCNGGACHGSTQGRGRFILSLIAASPEQDYLALTATSRGRLLNFSAPEASLLLQKPSGQRTHAGGVRLLQGSWEYRLLQQWIAQGASWERGRSELRKLVVEPPELFFNAVQQTRQLRVTALFADGSRDDVTAYCDFRQPEGDEHPIAEVSARGEVTSLHAGAMSLPVFYRGRVVTVPVWVAAPPSNTYTAPPAATPIDRMILARLRQLNIVPAPLSDDATFLRRVMIDTIATLPTPEELRRFRADPSPDKRTRKIEELLAHPRHASLWAARFWESTSTRADGGRVNAPAQLWLDWLRQRFAANTPYDRLVRDILCADSLEGRSPADLVEEKLAYDKDALKLRQTSYAQRRTLDLFWSSNRPQADPEEWAERVASVFMGVRIDCARCHAHPFGTWTPEDYRRFVAVFGSVRVEPTPEMQVFLTLVRRPAAQFREVRVVPVTAAPTVTPRILGGPEVALHVGDPREALWRWLVRKEDPQLARVLVQRVWSLYLGRGLAQPEDILTPLNPPAHPDVLDWLVEDFVAHGYDLRRLERQILQSSIYQLSIDKNDSNKYDETLYSRFYTALHVQPVLTDLLRDVLLSHESQEGLVAPPGFRSMELTAHLQRLPRAFFPPPQEKIDKLLARVGRQETRERCETNPWSSNMGTYLWINSSPFNEQLRKSPRLQQLMASPLDIDAKTDELFLAITSQLPTAQERQQVRQHLARENAEVRDAWMDVIWALVNSNRFLRRH